jgi:hypothetical protein
VTLSQAELDRRFAEVQFVRVNLGTATEPQIRWLIGYLEDKIRTLEGPKPAPSGSRGIMQLTEEHLNALNYVTKNAGRAFDIIPDDHSKNVRLAEDAVNIIKQSFGASSQKYITLYPTIG